MDARATKGSFKKASALLAQRRPRLFILYAGSQSPEASKLSINSHSYLQIYIPCIESQYRTSVQQIGTLMAARERRDDTHISIVPSASTREVVRQHDARTAPKESCVKLVTARETTIKTG